MSAGPPAVWDEQFDPKHDLAGPGRPTVRYALCTTPRCGSHFFGHLLQQSGLFGYPLEYFNPLNFPEWQKRAADDGTPEVLGYLERRRTSPNGCFGIKLHYSDLAPACAVIGLRSLIDDWRFVLLRRRDVLGQAVSWARAAQTRAWISSMPERAPASYDRDAIAYRLHLLLEHTAGWQRFLAENGVRPLELAYEDVAANPGGAVAEVAGLLGIDLPDPSPSGELPVKVQRTTTNDAWRERFVADMRERHQENAARRTWRPEVTAVRREPVATSLKRMARRWWHRGSTALRSAPP